MALGKGLKKYATSIAGGLFLLGMTTAGFAATTTDMVVIIDESGSMGSEQGFIGTYIQNMDTVLEQNGVTTNRYGLVGYGGHDQPGMLNDAAHKHLINGFDFGTPAQFATATGGLITSGGTEDGYEAMMYALNNYTFRTNAGASFFLITDEDRDTKLAPTVGYPDMLAALQNAGVVMHAMVNQRFYDTAGNAAVAIDASGNAYVIDAQGNLTTVPNGASRTINGTVNDSGTTDADYTELALATGGIAADLQANRNAINANTPVAATFAQLLSDIITQTTQQQTTVAGLLALAETPAQKAVARVLQNANNLNAIRAAINAMLTNSKKKTTLEQLSPRKVFAMVLHAIRSGTAKRRGMKRRMHRMRTGQAGQFDMTDFAFNYKGTGISGDMLKELLPGKLIGGAAGDSDLDPRHGFFISGSLSRGDYDRSGGMDPYDFDSRNLSVGTDYRLTRALTAGVSLSFETSDTNFEDLSEIDMKETGLYFYGMYTFAPDMYLEGTAGYGWTRYTAQRDTGLPGFGLATSNPKGNQLNLSLEMGRDFKYEKWRIEPMAGASYTRIRIDAYTEVGAGIANLIVSDQEAHSFIGTIGGRLGYESDNPNSLFTPEIHAFWEHEFANDSRSINSAFAGAPGTVFAVSTEEPDRDYVRIGFGLTGQLGDNTIVSVSGDTVIGYANLKEYTLSGNIKWKF
ncbi:MAG: autotransporter domain-containing protein [Desulfobacterales bacterium]|nr:autotransporter domain-containing protein [Desulfobacterales bacterium]